MSPVNIFAQVAFDLHPRVRAVIDDLTKDGQIDLDANNYPIVTKIERVGPNTQCVFVRNNKMENFLLNTRRRADPIMSFSPQDGFKRSATVRPSLGQSDKKPERQRRLNAFESLVEEILR